MESENSDYPVQELITVWKVSFRGEKSYRFDDVDDAISFIQGSIRNQVEYDGATLESERMNREEYLRAVELEDEGEEV